MKIDHLAIWVNDLERVKLYYEKYFHAKAGAIYVNPLRNFQSYFLSFEDGARLELMQTPGVPKHDDHHKQSMGLMHFAISVGSKNKVDELTATLRKDGHDIIGEPRTTGDGYYESVTLDPEGNRIEITI
jgi:lactoylglutathione lyase